METMDTIRMCKQCGAPLSADAPQGLCPKCLMQVGLGSGFQPLPSTSATQQKGPAPTPAELAKLFPQLEIVEMLGQGGMGIVYKARQRRLDRFVALKILPLETGREPHFAERFSREARALAKLTHPNIVAVHDSGQAGEYFYFVMEYVDGANLRQMMRAGTLTPQQALVIVPAICDALQYAHDEGVVHRDIKPENVLVDKKGRVKIADFGLAKLLGKEHVDYGLTASGAFMGTPKYMAPEQIEKPQEVDHRADIYSLGVIFYEMLTGELPLGRFAPPSRKVQVDVRLDEVVLRTLEKEPALRYQQASEIKNEVENISGLVEKLPPALRNAVGFEYRSKTTLFGWPLIHVAYGTDLRTGKKLIAKGIFAFGDVSKGVFAFGGVAAGFVAFGGAAFGVIALGGFGLGLLSLSGMGIGLIASYSGLAIAPIAMGGFAVGWYAAGGMVVGKNLAGGNMTTPEGLDFFRSLPSWSSIFGTWMVLFFGLMAASMIGPFIKWRKRPREIRSSTPNTTSATQAENKHMAVMVGVVLLTIVSLVVLWPRFKKNVGSQFRTPSSSVLEKFASSDFPLSKEFVATGPGKWSATVTNTQTLNLFEVPDPGIEKITAIYRAKIKAEGVVGRAYLEMLCRFPGQGEYFSRGLDGAISGTTDWQQRETPFFLKAGEHPDLIKLSVVVEGPGKISIKDVQLLKAPLP